LRYIGRGFLSKKYYFRPPTDLADPSCGFNAINLGKSDVEQNQVGLQFLSLLNRCESVRHDTNDLQIRPGFQRRSDEPPKRFVILYYQNAG